MGPAIGIIIDIVYQVIVDPGMDIIIRMTIIRTIVGLLLLRT